MGAQTQEQRSKSKGKLGLSLIIGILLIPMSAVAAVVLTDHAPEIGSATAAPTTAPGLPAIGQVVYSDVVATAEDLAFACGEGGLWLIESERAGSITALQQSALDALRGICEDQGTPLPGKDAPPPIVETRTIAIPGPAPAAPDTATPANPASADDHDDEGRHEDEDEDEDGATVPSDSAETYMVLHDQAIAEIEYAQSVGGSAEKITEARQKLLSAEQAAASSNYRNANDKAREAIEKAREAVGEHDDHDRGGD